jgi:PAS domain S-box-containing protein
MIEESGISVLHVDDDPDFTDLTADMLSEQGGDFTVETATTANEGLELLAANDLDCIVSDYEMPGQTGLEFLEMVRAEYPDLPFILYTGKGSEEVASDAIAAGVTDYLQKESGTSQYTVLANRIRNAVEKCRQQKRAQATRDQLRQIIDMLPQLIFAKDEAGEFLLANEATADAYGTTVDDLEGATDADFADSTDEAEQFRADDQAVIESGEPKHIPEESLTTANGETRLLETTKIPYSPVESDDDAVLGISTDVTERREREQELRQTNTVLRTIVENLPMGVLVEDAERDVLMANDLLGETLGIPVDSEELIGRDCAVVAKEFKHLFADPEEFIQGINNRIEQQEPVQKEEIFLSDGRVVERDYAPYTLPGGNAHLWLYRDITQRKQRKQELERSSQLLQDAQEVACVGGWEFDIQSETLQWSDEVYRIHGLALDADVTHEDAIGFYHSDDRSTIREALERLVAEGEPFDLELRIVTADGDMRWVRTLGEPVYDDDNIVTIQGTFQDITERKERERELRMVRERFERFAGNVKDAFFLLPTDYSETKYANPAVERIYGIRPEEAYDEPMSWLRHIHSDDKNKVLTDIDAQQNGATEWPIEQEFRIDHPDHGVRWVQARLDLITDENDDRSQIAGVTTDITEIKERERELEQLATKYELQYQTLFEEAPVMTVLTRPEDGRPIIEDCNSQFVETLGYDVDTIIGSELAEFYTPESVEKMHSGGCSRSHNGESDTGNRDLLTIDGEISETLLRSVPRRTADGEIIGTVAMYIDITERESVKRTNERLEEFTGIVSHDLRNPLNVATGRLELAAQECNSDHLDEVEQALGRMETLIDNLLMLAREGKDVTDPQPVDLTTVANRSWGTVDMNQAELVTNVERRALADRSRLKQVFENLFRNAVEHGGADVTVTVGELNNGFYIEDDGPGIPPDERDDIFEAGYSRSADGTGFGLSIVEQIANAHDWQIRVTDGTDGGVRFEIRDVELVSP